MNKKKVTIAIVVAVLAVIVIATIFVIFIGKNNNKTTNQNTVAEGNNNNENLQQIQAKIDEQQKVIDKINNDMTPLIEERDRLESELMSLTDSSEGQVVEEVAPEEETTETTDNAEENVEE